MVSDTTTDALIYWADSGDSFFGTSGLDLFSADALANALTPNSPKPRAVWKRALASFLQALELFKLCATIEYVSPSSAILTSKLSARVRSELTSLGTASVSQPSTAITQSRYFAMCGN